MFIFSPAAKLLLMSLAGFALWYAYGFVRDRQIRENKWLVAERAPKILRRSKLVMMEQDIDCASPIALKGRPDTVFETGRGELVILDTKTRKSHVYADSDILQMSVYRYILERGYGKKVSRYGYVRSVVGQYKPTVQYHKVHLLSWGAVEHLYREYKAIQEGRFQPDCHCGKC